MNKALQEFERLAAIARREAAPAIDVRHQVIHRIQSYEEAAVDQSLAWFAAASAAMASFMLVSGGYVVYLMSDPLRPLFEIAAYTTP